MESELNPYHLPPSYVPKSGWVQIGDICNTNRLIVKICMPMILERGVPFYLYVHDELFSICMLIFDENILDKLLVAMGGQRETYCWMDVKQNKLNFDTHTQCKGW